MEQNLLCFQAVFNAMKLHERIPSVAKRVLFYRTRFGLTMRTIVKLETGHTQRELSTMYRELEGTDEYTLVISKDMVKSLQELPRWVVDDYTLVGFVTMLADVQSPFFDVTLRNRRVVIRALLKLGMSQVVVAERFGLTQGAISRIKREITDTNLISPMERYGESIELMQLKPFVKVRV